MMELNCTEFWTVDNHVFLHKELAEKQQQIIENKIYQEVEDYKAGKIFSCYYTNHETRDGGFDISVNKAIIPRIHHFPTGSIEYNDALNFTGKEKIQWGNPALRRFQKA